VLHPVLHAVSVTIGAVKDAFGAAIDGIKAIWGKLVDIFKVPVKIVIGIVDKFDEGVNWVLDKVGLKDQKLPRIGAGLPALQSGGVIPGQRAPANNRDNVLGVDANGVPRVRVEPEEYIVNREMTAKHLPLLNAINSGTLPGYKSGGRLGWIKDKLGAATPDFVGNAIHGIGDAGGWVADTVAHTLRAGAADAVAGTYKAISDPLFATLPHGLIPDFTHKTADSLAASVVEWIRGKEEVLGDFSGADGTSAPLIIEYLNSKGIHGGATTTTGGKHADGSWHYKGMAVDFGNAAWPNQRGIFNVFDAVRGSLLELFWDPAGHYIKNGRVIPGAIGGHGDHVHVAATMDAMNRLLGRSTGPAGETKPVGAWRGLVLQVLAELGLSGSLVGKVLSQMQTESGGNAGAVQGVRDVNSASGNLARGLMQVIPPTFNAYAGPYRGAGIFNPHANLYAALNYARHRYGPGLSGLGQGHGYDSGGYLMPGLTMAYNNTSKPEPVFTSGQWDDISALTSGATGGSSSDVVVELRKLHRTVARQPAAIGDAVNSIGGGARLRQRTAT
jgi:hypothetical protein